MDIYEETYTDPIDTVPNTTPLGTDQVNLFGPIIQRETIALMDFFEKKIKANEERMSLKIDK